MNNHRHTPRTTTTRPFFGPVSRHENPVAHGNVCYVDTCKCGATRRTNSNAGQQERGPWVAAAAAGE